MKSFESRLVRLERARWPHEPNGMYLEELNFLVAMLTIWPDMKTAPKFLQAECYSLSVRWDAIQAREKKRRTSHPSAVSPHG